MYPRETFVFYFLFKSILLFYVCKFFPKKLKSGYDFNSLVELSVYLSVNTFNIHKRARVVLKFMHVNKDYHHEFLIKNATNILHQGYTKVFEHIRVIVG